MLTDNEFADFRDSLNEYGEYRYADIRADGCEWYLYGSGEYAEASFRANAE